MENDSRSDVMFYGKKKGRSVLRIELVNVCFGYKILSESLRELTASHFYHLFNKKGNINYSRS
ncbi:hypothetical protein OMO38_07060 [Chryseobacterium sp. 09-1422]|uniref:KTSC domain-containing protein n=1 Tax=Chryseobacterium kimseyorum TaxID=2984028 RepID=A0ABT3HWV9_9FLAO|nr:hypothetical protein [Chryseobacterium kimseyorum]MCW3168283.1 hypothetical protein [Chryseobacterium kimseyorum]